MPQLFVGELHAPSRSSRYNRRIAYTYAPVDYRRTLGSQGVTVTSHELARILLDLPDLPVRHIWDGSARTAIDCVWEAAGETEGWSGKPPGPFIATAQAGEVVYEDHDRPRTAPRKDENHFWFVPEGQQLI